MSRHGKFVEHDFPFQDLISTSQPSLTSISGVSPHFVVPTSQSSTVPISPVSPLPTGPVPLISSSSPFLHNSSSLITTTPAPTSHSSTPAVNSSSSPSLSQLPHAGHPMITRLKIGIIVPKVPFSLLVHSPPSSEPTSFKEAMFYPEWRQCHVLKNIRP